MDKKRKIIWIGVAAAVAIALLGWFFLRPADKKKLYLETGEVTRISISSSVSATGTVEPVTKVEVGTQVSGIIDKLYVDYNDEVKAGQVIAEMDKVTLQAELESAQSTLASSKTEYDYRLKEYNRAKALHEKELISDADYDLAVYNYQKAQNAYKQSQASIVKVRRNLGYATITSPIDGVVISRAVEEGQTVAAGFSTPTLFVIANDLTKMRVIANVDEADIGQVLEGQDVEFTVDAYPDDVFSGLVQQVRLEATTTSNVVTYEVVITADNPDLKLKPGLTASVTIYTLHKDGVLSVPTKSLRFQPDPDQLASLGLTADPDVPEGRHVWIKDGPVLRARSVETGDVMDDRTEIVEGLEEGEKIVAGLTVTMPQAKASARSPFMPGPPGSRNGKNEKKESK
ncbi:MAG: efflux RND transporter periplasmic adaptor subunit [Bacteroidales bacterium]|nr:efflux RND transporter periplasmic adaptor subunit [Bacteroidales bacterium]